jgi:hypothetical protein
VGWRYKAILISSPRRRKAVIFTPFIHPPQGKILQYPLSRRLGESQSQSQHSGEEKDVWSLLCCVYHLKHIVFRNYGRLKQTGTISYS